MTYAVSETARPTEDAMLSVNGCPRSFALSGFLIARERVRLSDGIFWVKEG